MLNWLDLPLAFTAAAPVCYFYHSSATFVDMDVLVLNIMKNKTSRIVEIGIGMLAVVSPALAGVSPTPEPTTIALVGGGLGVLILMERRRRSKK